MILLNLFILSPWFIDLEITNHICNPFGPNIMQFWVIIYYSIIIPVGCIASEDIFPFVMVIL